MPRNIKLTKDKNVASVPSADSAESLYETLRQKKVLVTDPTTYSPSKVEVQSKGITSILDRTLSKNVDLSPIFTDELFGTVEVHESSERKEYNDTKAVHDSVDALEKYKNVIEQPHYPSEENLQKSGKVLRNAAIDRRVMYNKKKKANATEPITTKPSDMPVNFQSKRTVPKRDRVHRKIPLDSEITGLNENDGNTIRRVRQILRDRIVGEINKDMSKRNIKISAEDIRMFWKNTVRLMDRVVMLENSCIIPCKDGLPKITLNITNGRISENSTEMVPFQRICESSGTLHLARQVLRRMEVFCQEHVISWAEVDIAETLRLMDETHLTCRQHLNESKIRNCFANKDQIEGILDFSGHRYAGQRGRERAAIKIQATWLMYRTKAHFNLVEPRLRALGVFFKRWASKKKNALMRQCIAYLKQFHMKRAAKLQTEMPKRIQSLANNEYAVIHIPSYGKDEKFEEFLHFARALDVSIGSIRVILVFKEPMDDVSGEIMKATLMRIEGISNTSISIITPELVYEGSSSLVNLILLSHETICDIKDAVGDSTAVIFCGKPTENDYILSSILEFPVYGVPWDRLPAIQSVEFIGDVQTLINEKELDADYPGRNTKSDIYFNYFVDFNGKIVDLGTVEYIDSIDLDIIPAQTFPIINVSEIICKLASKFHEYSGVGYLTIKVAKTKSSITLMEVMPYFNEKIVKLLHFRTSSNTYRDENGAFLFDVRKAQIPEFSFLSLVREIDLDSARKVNQPKQMENRVMLWINNCSHSNMTYFPLNVFQTMARSAQIDFEEQYRTGTLFVTSKQLYTANRQVALYVIGKSFLDALQATRTNMKALHDLMHIDGMKVSSNIKVIMNVLTNLEAEFLDENTTERKLDANLTIAENDKNRKAKSLCTPGIFENTFGADAESKIKFVKTFIAADVLYDVFRQLDEHISVVETKRYQEWIDQKLEALRSKSSKV